MFLGKTSILERQRGGDLRPELLGSGVPNPTGGGGREGGEEEGGEREGRSELSHQLPIFQLLYL